MNRLILIGNGFDLAHGLKTSYRNFIQWYFVTCCTKAYHSAPFDDRLISVKHRFASYINIGKINTVEGYVNFCFDNHLKEFASNQNISLNEWRFIEPIFQISFKSLFFKHLVTACHDSGWVDIENEFYRELIELLGKGNSESKNKSLKALNADMESLINY
jgi:hypothetical protein